MEQTWRSPTNCCSAGRRLIDSEGSFAGRAALVGHLSPGLDQRQPCGLNGAVQHGHGQTYAVLMPHGGDLLHGCSARGAFSRLPACRGVVAQRRAARVHGAG